MRGWQRYLRREILDQHLVRVASVRLLLLEVRALVLELVVELLEHVNDTLRSGAPSEIGMPRKTQQINHLNLNVNSRLADTLFIEESRTSTQTNLPSKNGLQEKKTQADLRLELVRVGLRGRHGHRVLAELVTLRKERADHLLRVLRHELERVHLRRIPLRRKTRSNCAPHCHLS